MQPIRAITAFMLASLVSIALSACQTIKNSYLNLKQLPDMGVRDFPVEDHPIS